MSLVCRWSGVSVELGLGERIPASLWDGAAKDLFRKNLTQDEHGNWRTIKTPQWEQLTSHTARRTFATLAVQRGTPVKVVMNITGHSTEREFNKYVNISAEKNAEVFASFWN